MRKWKGIVLHHSETPDGTLEDTRAIFRYHVHTLGWKDIGYHFIVEKIDGRVMVIKGRSLDLDGAHALGYNKTHIGICVVGNFDKIEPDNDIYLTLNNLIHTLQHVYKIKINNIKGHRDTFTAKSKNKKTCPGLLFDIQKAIYFWN